MIKTMDEAVAALMGYIPASGLMHHNYKLDRMRQLMELLDNPQDSFKSIHIAGTSGKTSTAYFIRGLLQTAGVKTGLTISPHITSITERVQVDGAAVGDEMFIRQLNELIDKVGTSTIQPTYFELLVALAYMIFREEKVDYAVIETGLGGLLDATNVITRQDKICVITDIGFDHMDVLGTTLREIAAQKAGIIQSGNLLVLQHQDTEIEKVISDYAATKNVRDIILVEPGDALSDLPIFQQRNWSAAMAAYEVVAKREGLEVLSNADLRNIIWQQPPGRMEMVTVNDKTIIMDGAHNPQKLHALVNSIREKGFTSLDIIVSFVSDKHSQLEANLRELQPMTNQLVVTDFSVMRDVGKSASSSSDIAAAARQLGMSPVEIHEPRQALERLLVQSESPILITGSLYLVAALRDHVMGLSQE